MSATSSRLRHHGSPGLQAQKCESTANTTARAIVIGTTFAIVWPIITTTSNGKLDMAASHDRKSHEYPLALKELGIGIGRYCRGCCPRAPAHAALHFID